MLIYNKRREKFREDEVDYSDIIAYVDTTIKSLGGVYKIESWDSKARKYMMKKGKEFVENISEIENIHENNKAYEALQILTRYNGGVGRFFSKMNGNTAKREQKLQKKCEEFIKIINGAPTKVGIKKEDDKFYLKDIGDIFGENSKEEYGASPTNIYKGKYATIRGSLLQEMYAANLKNNSKERKNIIQQSMRDKEKYEEEYIETSVIRNDDLYSRSFDSKAAIESDKFNVFILEDLSQINENKYCFRQHIPTSVFEGASKEETKQLKQYQSKMLNKLAAMEQVEQLTKELIEPRRIAFELNLAITSIREGRVKVSQKEKLLEELNKQLKMLSKEEQKIKKKIDKIKRTADIGPYDRAEYEAYSKIAEMQERVNATNEEKDQLREDIKSNIISLQGKLEKKSLTNDERTKLEEELREQNKRLNELETKRLTPEEKERYMDTISDFWKQVAAREMLPEKKRGKLLLSEGKKKSSTNKEEKFVENLQSGVREEYDIGISENGGKEREKSSPDKSI